MKRSPQHKRSHFAPQPGKSYLAFNKPYGVVSQFSAIENSDKQTLAAFAFPKDVYPIGRLDWDSEGLLLLSDDGNLNHTLLDPQNKHERAYFAQVENIPDRIALQKLRDGVIIEGKKTLPAEANLIVEPELPPRLVPIRFRKNIPTSWIELRIHEGRNRQVRKMTAAVGHPTLRLMRVAIGSLSIFDLKIAPGQYTRLTPAQVDLLFE